MKTRTILTILAGAALVTAALFIACQGPIDPPGKEAAEYDAQGRRLITVTIPTGGDDNVRAVNKPIAQSYTDFYEVVFQEVNSTGATPTGTYVTASSISGQPLTVRLSDGAYYYAILFAGSKIAGKDEGVLLAVDFENQRSPTLSSPIHIDSAALPTIEFALKALDLGFDNLVVKDSTGSPIAPKKPSGATPYYKLLNNATVTGEYTINYQKTPGTPPTLDVFKEGLAAATGITPAPVLAAMYSAPNTSVSPPFPGIIIPVKGKTTYDATTGKVNFTLGPIPKLTDPVPEGLAKLIIDIPVKVCFDNTSAAKIKATTAAKSLVWHIRNGVDTGAYDSGTNSGSGILFAVGTSLSYTDIIIAIPAL
ncbi:hypothetical protein AGMMS49940_04240 [Spirochaetia bacterium]|nr:hypothetical protein AGMMS49940_04240 [Spirochaetia bacterium]